MELLMDQELKSDPRFQVLLAKVETYLQQHQAPKYKELKVSNKLSAYLEKQAEQAWEQIRQAREAGYSLDQAEELAAPFLYPAISETEPTEEADPEATWLSERFEKRVL
jgi:hypothetical protein